MKLYNRNFPVGERIEYMGWVNEGILNSQISWQTYKPRFLVLKGTEVLLFDNPPLNIAMLVKPAVAYKVYQTMFRVVKESETVDSRQHCFLLQSSGQDPRYLSVETRQELLRIENSWNAAIVTSVIKLGVNITSRRQLSFFSDSRTFPSSTAQNLRSVTPRSRRWLDTRLDFGLLPHRGRRSDRHLAVQVLAAAWVERRRQVEAQTSLPGPGDAIHRDQGESHQRFVRLQLQSFALDLRVIWTC